ncbi:MAG: cysteine desulfurase [Planctomyces sp.]|nr:cysteine desulfurase [Planctomyces sp.]
MERSAEFSPVYLDYCSTTPLDPRVLEAMLPCLSGTFGNASSVHHSFGREAAAVVEIARERVATLAKCDPAEVIWTSGATEANNLAIKGTRRRTKPALPIITQSTEHPSVLEPCKASGATTFLPVDRTGQICLDDLRASILSGAGLVSVMAANNETGVLFPIAEIAETCDDSGTIFHTDATQLFGKLPLPSDKYDLLSVSSHKLYGPKGVGALIVRRRKRDLKIHPLFEGGGQERGIRSGTLNVPSIVGFGEACRLASLEMGAESQRLMVLRGQFESCVRATIPDVHVNGGESGLRLPHVSNLAFRGVDAESLILAMSQLAISSGSACSSSLLEPSHVLVAMGADPELQRASVRVSFGRQTTDEDVAVAIREITGTVSQLRKLKEAW